MSVELLWRKSKSQPLNMRSLVNRNSMYTSALSCGVAGGVIISG